MPDFAGNLDFTLEVLGEVQVRRRLRGVLANAEDLTPALELIAARFYRHVGEAFATGGAVTAGGAWTPLSERYRKRKEKLWPGQPTLTASSKLAASLRPGGEGSAKEIGPHRLRIASNRRTKNGRWNLGQIHQKGSTTRRIPVRKIIDLPETEKHRYMQLLRAHLMAPRG